MSAGNIARSGASYEAVLVDHVTGSIDTIVHSLQRLEAAFAGVAAPAREVNAALAAVAQNAGRMSNAFNQELVGSLTASLTKFRTLALSGGQAVSQALATIGTAARSAGYALIGAGAAAGGAIGYFVSLSAAAEETQNKFNVIFGANAASAEQWVNGYAKQVGRAKTTLKGFAADFRATMEETGQSPEILDKFAKGLTQLTIDIGSFQNRADQDVFQRLISGLNGSTEAVELLNINLRESSLEKQMVKLGMAGKFSDLDDGQKKLLRLSAMIDGAKHAMDDATKTTGSFSNSFKRLQAAVIDAGEVFGKTFEKTLTEPLANITKTVVALGEASKNITADNAKAFFGAILASVAVGGGLIALAAAAGTAAGVVITLSTALSGLAALASFTLVAPFAGLAIVLGGILVSVLAIGAGLALWNKAFSLETFRAISRAFVQLFDFVNVSLKGLATAVALGDWDSAAQIASLTFKIAFQRMALDLAKLIADAFFEGLYGAWSKFQQTIGSVIYGAKFPELAPRGGDLEKNMMKDLNDLAELLKKMRLESAKLPNAAELLKSELQGIIDSIRGSVEIELSRRGPYDIRRAESLGSTASLFAANASSFAPTFKPEAETKKTNKLLEKNNSLTEKGNQALKELGEKEWLFK